MDQYGHGRGTMHGGFCEFSLVKEKFCFVIETNISSDEAALLEPMGERECLIYSSLIEVRDRRAERERDIKRLRETKSR
jgi:hypothetical protein